MSRPTNAWRKVMAQPGHFTLRVLKAFQKNQGLLLSGALAYYLLLSVIPLFTFLLLMLSHVVDEAALLATLRRYIGLIIPGDAAAVRASTKHPRASRSRELGRAMRDAVFQLACVQRARERLVHYFYSSGAPQTKAADRLRDSSLRLYPTARRGLPGDDRRCQSAAIDER